MASRKKYAVLVMLLLLLAAAIANFFVVNKAYDSSLARLATHNDDSAPPTAVVATPQGVGKDGAQTDVQTITYRGPGWRGDVTLNKTTDGSYEVTVRASDLYDKTVPITSFEIDVRRPDSDKPILMPVFNQKGDGFFTAIVQFPGKGDWEVRVQMHKENQTLEFARRFRVE